MCIYRSIIASAKSDIRDRLEWADLRETFISPGTNLDEILERRRPQIGAFTLNRLLFTYIRITEKFHEDEDHRKTQFANEIVRGDSFEAFRLEAFGEYVRVQTYQRDDSGDISQ